MKKSATVEEYFNDHSEWNASLTELRSILLDSGLIEKIKWGAPIYTTLGDKNIVGMAAFKSYVGLWFHQGVFLADSQKKLMNAQDTTKALRQWRFMNIDEILSDKKIISEYIQEATLNQENGLELKPERNKPLILAKELKEVLASDKSLQNAFKILSLSKRREFSDHIESAKRETTKLSRLEKIIPMIQEGTGLHDKYKNC